MSLYDDNDSDDIMNGGSYITKHSFGGEVYNFRNSNGISYGYVMTNSETINLKSHKKNLVASEKERRFQAQSDLMAKKNVEERAIKRRVRYYEDLEYTCISVEKENKDWDLEVSRGNARLLVEVKGVSQSYISVLLSKNEYKKMQENQ